jgi:DNA-binding response OmpR family regulator
MEAPRRKTIVLYSADMDFCMSLRLLFQERYRMITTTDVGMLLPTIRAFQPDLVIADAIPTERMRNRFETMRREFPAIRIMLFYAPRFSQQAMHEYVRAFTDVALTKPLDLEEVIVQIDKLTVMG